MGDRDGFTNVLTKPLKEFCLTHSRLATHAYVASITKYHHDLFTAFTKFSLIEA
jgi:phosphoenolpyruvate carboxylase